MKHAAAILICLAALGSAHAAEEAQPAAWGSVKLKTPPAPSARAPLSLETGAPQPTASAPAAAVPASGAQPAAQNPQLPAIPAAGALTPSASVPAGATAAQLPSTLQPGEPAKTYPTLSAAAKDGIDPMKPAVKPVPAPVAKAFDATDPQAYLALIKKHLGPNGLYMVLGGLVVVFGGLLVLRRR